MQAVGLLAAERVYGVLDMFLGDFAGIGEPGGAPHFEGGQDGDHVVFDGFAAAGLSGRAGPLLRSGNLVGTAAVNSPTN